MIIILLLNKLLKNSNIDKKNINSFFIIILFYGLSVSGLNNIFAIISIIIILDTKYFYKYDNYNNNFNS